jgi:hypothetical protein
MVVKTDFWSNLVKTYKEKRGSFRLFTALEMR